MEKNKRISIIDIEKNTYNGYIECILDYDFECLYDIKQQDKLIKKLSQELLEVIKNFDVCVKTVVVFGLGNYGMIADSLGVKTCNKIITNMNNKLETFMFKTGIEYFTGIPTSDTIKAICDYIKPDICILIDSFVSSDFTRLGNSIQIQTKGMVAGSGLGKRGKMIDYDYLKIPVLCVGVPVIVQSNTICKDTTKNVVLTLKDIDEIIEKNSKIIAYAVNLITTDFTLNEIKKIFE